MDGQAYYEKLLSIGSIPPPTLKLETPLYRYRGNVEHALQEIREQYVYTSYAGEQNDPFDSCYLMTFEEALEYEEIFKFYFVTYIGLKRYSCYRRIRESFEDQFNTKVSLRQFSEMISAALKNEGITKSADVLAKYYYDNYLEANYRRNYWKIACFSEKRDSIPMWAYYAANHTGLCFKYDFSLLNEEDSYNRCVMESLHKVWYSNNKPQDPEGNFSYLVKAQEWSHEQEWRLVNWKYDDRIVLRCMTEVYLGIKSSGELIERTIDAIKESGKKIKLFWCRPNTQEYRIDFVEVYLSI